MIGIGIQKRHCRCNQKACPHSLQNSCKDKYEWGSGCQDNNSGDYGNSKPGSYQERRADAIACKPGWKDGDECAKKIGRKDDSLTLRTLCESTT